MHKLVPVVLLIAPLLCGFMAKLPTDSDLDIGDQAYAWSHMQGNLIAQERLLDLAAQNKPRDTLFINVNLVELPGGIIRPNARVLVKDGKIAWIRDGSQTEVNNVLVVDGKGRYLAPGLTDMHVHTHDDADYLLQLSAGVTTIREMNGWVWRLERRKMLERGGLFAPNMFITGRILNSSDFGGYAIPISGEDEARSAVRQTRADGYDAVKIHNGLSNEEFHAIADESRKVGLKLVGHIPVAVSVVEAVAEGMHTAEHFKGYIDDSRLEISQEDWVTPSIGMNMYLTPTFYAAREHLRGPNAAEIVIRDGDKVPPHRMFDWQAYAADPGTDSLTRLRQSIRPKSEEIFKTLLPHNVRWLAGTDSGGYDLMVPGEALIEELEIMEGLGLSTLETLRAATTTAAEALGWQDKTGRIAPGLSADLILLEENPLETVGNLRRPAGVMVRGIWIDDPASLSLAPADYATVHARVSPRLLEEAVERAEANAKAGLAQSTMSLRIWLSMMEAFEQPDLARRLNALETK